jgi:FAD:protein FMN transferase
MSEHERPGGRHPSRREFLTLGAGVFVAAALPLAARRPPRVVRRGIPVMGTTAEVVVVHRDARYAQGAVEAALEELRAVEAAMSRFRPDSEVGRLNAAAGRAAVTISPSTARVLEAGLHWAEASGGRFDPCLGSAVARWDVGARREPLSPGEVRALAGGRPHRALELEDRGRRAHLATAAAAVDLGGIAKGYGVDAAVAALREWGITSALVGAGGDLYALGRGPEGDPWRIGVRSPEARGRIDHTLALEDRGVATSGDYEQFFEHEGRRYHHLLDPASGEPRRTPMRSVTVVADSCMDADAASTAVYGCERDEVRAVLAAGGRGAEIAHVI